MKHIEKINIDDFMPGADYIEHRRHPKTGHIFLESRFRGGSVGMNDKHVIDWRASRRRCMHLRAIADDFSAKRWAILTNAFKQAFGEPKFGKADRSKSLVVVTGDSEYSTWAYDGIGLRTTSLSRLINEAMQDSNIRYQSLSDDDKSNFFRFEERSRAMYARANIFGLAWTQAVRLRIDEFMKSKLDFTKTNEYFSSFDMQQRFFDSAYIMLDDGVEEFLMPLKQKDVVERVEIFDGRSR